jgi:hypothetical protein
MSSTNPYFVSVYLTAGQHISNFVVDASAAGTGTSYIAFYNATTSLGFSSYTAAAGVQSIAFSYTVSSTGFYWVGIQTGATLYSAAPSAVTNIGYTPAANTLSGSRSVQVNGQALNATISGTPVVAAKIPWVGLN